MRKIRSFREKIWQEEIFPACNQKEMKTILPFSLHKKEKKMPDFLLPNLGSGIARVLQNLWSECLGCVILALCSTRKTRDKIDLNKFNFVIANNLVVK